MLPDLDKRRRSAHEEARRALALIDIARRSVYGVPDLFLARVELALTRLELLERALTVEVTMLRAAGPLDIPAFPEWDSSSARTKKKPETH